MSYARTSVNLHGSHEAQIKKRPLHGNGRRVQEREYLLPLFSIHLFITFLRHHIGIEQAEIIFPVADFLLQFFRHFAQDFRVRIPRQMIACGRVVRCRFKDLVLCCGKSCYCDIRLRPRPRPGEAGLFFRCHDVSLRLLVFFKQPCGVLRWKTPLPVLPHSHSPNCAVPLTATPHYVLPTYLTPSNGGELSRSVSVWSHLRVTAVAIPCQRGWV